MKRDIADDAAALRENDRLISKGKHIAEFLRIERCIRMVKTVLASVSAEEAGINELSKRATSLEKGEPWGTPVGAPYDAGFIGPAYPGQTSDKTRGSK